MLWTIAFILTGLWMLVLLTGNTIGSFVHGLLVIAVIVNKRRKLDEKNF
jgi:hypothetical protein